MKSIVRLIISVIFVVHLDSCQNNCFNDNNDSDSIVVYYYTGLVEFPVRKSLSDMLDSSLKAETDSIIYLDDTDYRKVDSILYDKQVINSGESVDCRLLIKHDSTCVAFGYPDMFVSGGDDSHIYGCCNNMNRILADAKRIYYLKCISGYYNCFSKEELVSDRMINKWGIPVGYYDMLKKGEIMDSQDDRTESDTDASFYTEKAVPDDIKKIIVSRKIVIKRGKQ